MSYYLYIILNTLGELILCFILFLAAVRTQYPHRDNEKFI